MVVTYRDYIHATVPKKLIEELKIKRDQTGAPLSRMVEFALIDWLKKEEKAK